MPTPAREEEARTTSNDPDLDLLVLRFHLESGARREGALNVRVGDLDARRATVWLREKGDSEREQPVSPSLLALLERHAEARGRPHDAEPVFRTAKLDTLAFPGGGLMDHLPVGRLLTMGDRHSVPVPHRVAEAFVPAMPPPVR